jgi:hypothetical protein
MANIYLISYAPDVSDVTYLVKPLTEQLFMTCLTLLGF